MDINSKSQKLNTDMNDIIFLKPILKERIWGGYNLPKKLNITSERPIGEAWIFSTLVAEPSELVTSFDGIRSVNDIICKHPSIITNFMAADMGLLVKLIDAHDDLSIQVHPNDTYARSKNSPYGKTEWWYILDAKPHSKIIVGFKSDVAVSSFNNYGDISAYREHHVKKGDFVFIPAGTVHAIGKGIQLIEVQQPSDITYRLFDYNRLDASGKKRPLHLKEAAETINYSSNAVIKNINDLLETSNVARLCSCDYFTIDYVNVRGKISINTDGLDYSLIFVLSGNGHVNTRNKSIDIEQDSFFMIPNNCGVVTMMGDMKILLIKRKMIQKNQLYVEVK